MVLFHKSKRQAWGKNFVVQRFLAEEKRCTDKSVLGREIYNLNQYIRVNSFKVERTGLLQESPGRSVDIIN